MGNERTGLLETAKIGKRYLIKCRWRYYEVLLSCYIHHTLKYIKLTGVFNRKSPFKVNAVNLYKSLGNIILFEPCKCRRTDQRMCKQVEVAARQNNPCRWV